MARHTAGIWIRNGEKWVCGMEMWAGAVSGFEEVTTEYTVTKADVVSRKTGKLS